MCLVRKRVSKVEFVWLMLWLSAVDPERYQELRDAGWEIAAQVESETPN